MPTCLSVLVWLLKEVLCCIFFLVWDVKKKWMQSPPSSSFLSAFITSVSDQTRVSVSIKLCSLWDDIYVRGQLIFSCCNYWQRSMKYRCSCHTPSSCCLANQCWPSQQSWRPPRTRAAHIQWSNKRGTLWELWICLCQHCVIYSWKWYSILLLQ